MRIHRVENPEDHGLRRGNATAFDRPDQPTINPRWNLYLGRWEHSPTPVLFRLKRSRPNVRDVVAALYIMFRRSQLLQAVLGLCMLALAFALTLLLSVG